VDDAYAIGRSMMRISPAHTVPAKQDFAGVGLKLTTENIYESALTRTILSYQTVDLPRPDRDRNFVQRLGGSKALGNFIQRDCWLNGRGAHRSRLTHGDYCFCSFEATT
jgi:hypothetical protein